MELDEPRMQTNPSELRDQFANKSSIIHYSFPHKNGIGCLCFQMQVLLSYALAQCSNWRTFFLSMAMDTESV